MRLKLFSVLFILLNLHISSAQMIKSYGFLVGYTSANQEYTGIPPENFELKPISGFLIGIYGEFLSSSHFSILSQIEYTQRGTSFDGVTTDPDGNSYNDTYYSRLDYLSIPISGKFFLKNLKYSPYLIAGMRYDHLLSFDSFSLEPVYNKFEETIFGAQFGIGIDFINVIDLNFSIEVRYNLDLTNSLNLDGKSAYNKAIDLILFVNFN